MGERAAWGKMAAMCGHLTLLAGNADETSSLYIYLCYHPITLSRFYCPHVLLILHVTFHAHRSAIFSRISFSLSFSLSISFSLSLSLSLSRSLSVAETLFWQQ